MTYVKTYLPSLKTHVVNLKRDAKDLSRDLYRLEVRGKLGSKTLWWRLRNATPRLELQKEYAYEKRLSAITKVLIKLTLCNGKHEKIKNRKKLAVSRGYILVIFCVYRPQLRLGHKKCGKTPKITWIRFPWPLFKLIGKIKSWSEREACVINIAAAAHYSIKQATRAFQQL